LRLGAVLVAGPVGESVVGRYKSPKLASKRRFMAYFDRNGELRRISTTPHLIVNRQK
jgi:hypothetical protein